MKVNIRFTKKEEYLEINELRKKNYPNFAIENDKIFLSKIEQSEYGCLVADLDGIVGFIISFPYFVGKILPTNSIFNKVEESNCCYINDLFVAEEFRNKQIGLSLTESVISDKSNKIFCTTSLKEHESFWNKIGFRSFFKTEYCGKEASYMMLIK